MTEGFRSTDLSIDQQLALRTAAVNLRREFEGVFGTEFPKPWTDEVVRAADVVVTMGCGDACPVFPGKRYLDWELSDPNGLDVEQVRPIRDQIELKVRGLLRDLDVPVAEGV